MGSEVIEKLPTIDFGKLDLKPGSKEWNSVKDKVYKALEEYGSFEAIFDETLISKERLYEKLIQVFSFPWKTKFSNSEKATSGYNWNPQTPLHERITIHQVLNPGVIETFSKTIWPDGEQEFCDLARSYTKTMSEFDDMVREMVFEKLGLEKYWDEHKNSTACGFGMFHYRVPEGDESNVGLRPHTDKLLTTILSQNQIGTSGLQVKKKNGQWFDVAFSSTHSYIFLVADCLTALTNGRLPGAIHRVNIGENERYSMGFSILAKEGCIIKVADELVDEHHPLLYKPFDPFKYLQFSLEDNGGTADGVGPTPLEIFCGV